MVVAAIPHHHCAAAILALWDDAFEVFVFDRVIFNFYGKMFFTSLPRKPFWQRPRLQHPFHLQAEIVVQTAGVMFLNHKARRAFDFLRQRFACWLSSLLEVAFPFVLLEGHFFAT